MKKPWFDRVDVHMLVKKDIQWNKFKRKLASKILKRNV